MEIPAFDPSAFGHLPDRLVTVAARVHAGVPRTRTLREVLGWFGQQRRGSVVNQRMAAALAELRLTTEPNFLTVGLDERIGFVPVEEESPEAPRELRPEVVELLEEVEPESAPNLGEGQEAASPADRSAAANAANEPAESRPPGPSNTLTAEAPAAATPEDLATARDGGPPANPEADVPIAKGEPAHEPATPQPTAQEEAAAREEAEREEAERREASETIANLQVEQYTVARYLDDERLEHGVHSVRRQASVEEALTTMRLYEYSQIPVTVRDDRELLGTVTWASLGRAIQINGGLPERLEDCWDTAQSIVKTSDSIVKLFRAVTQNGFALVRGKGERFVTIFTATDLGQLYEDISLNFVRLGEIEAHVRKLVRRIGLTPEQLREYVHPDARPPQRVEDLSFGAYKRILDRDENFARTGLQIIQRKQFCDRLEEVTELRNGVMHFDPDGLDARQVRVLENFWRFLREVA